MKKCTKCLIEKENINFYIERNVCKPCFLAQKKVWWIKENYWEKYYLKNKEKINQKNKIWKKKNRRRVLKRASERRRENIQYYLLKEAIKREIDRKKYNEYASKWREKNQEYVRKQAIEIYYRDIKKSREDNRNRKRKSYYRNIEKSREYNRKSWFKRKYRDFAEIAKLNHKLKKLINQTQKGELK